MGKELNKKSMNEQQVLKKLKIDNFRDLSKDKLIEFVSMIPDMDPEVAKLAVNQYPNFSATMKTITTEYKTIVETGLKSNDDSMKELYEAAKTVLNSLDKLLENKDLSENEKMEIADKMQAVLELLSKKDSEHKKFIRDIVGMASLVSVVVVAASASLLGGKFKFPNNKG